MRIHAFAIGLLAATALAACSDTSTSTTASGPQAPEITELMPMAGALHVNWKNTTADCDAVEGERKSDKAAYAVIFTVPGAVDNKMDNDAREDMTYTYRLRCKKAGAYSDYSKEMSANPHDAMTDMDAGMDSGTNMDSGMDGGM